MSYMLEDLLMMKMRELTGLCHYNTRKTELIARCPFPGCELEEGKTHKHGRLYIDTKDPVFHCFRCQRSGSIFKLLRFLRLEPKDFLDLEQVKQFNPSKVRTEDMQFKSRKNFSFDKIEEAYTSKIFQDKVMYLKNRLGSDVNLDKIPNLIFNITDFVNKNRIEICYKDKQNLDWYNNNFIGFLGVLGNVLTMRCINEVSGESYHKIYFGKQGHFKDFYGIKIGYVRRDSINKIILMEGTFDLLLGCRIPETKELRKECCYAACGFGSNYQSLVRSVVNHLKLSVVDVVIFSDKDKKLDDWAYKKLTEEPRIRNIEMIYNKSGHDFGESPVTPTSTSFSPQGYFKKREYVKKIVKTFN